MAASCGLMVFCLPMLLWWQTAGDVERLQRAVALTRAHRYAEAQSVIQGIAIPAAPEAALAFHRLRGSIDAGLLRYLESDAEMQAALALAPQDELLRKAAAATAALAGDASERQGQSLDAVHSYERAVRLDPSQEHYRLLLAIELLQHQTFEPALLILRKATLDFGSSARLQTALGVAYFASGVDFSKASVAFLQALAIDPAFAPPREYLFDTALLERGLPGNKVTEWVCGYADSHPVEARANAVCGSLLLRLAEAEGHASNEESAMAPILARLRKAARADPNDPVARCQYGRALAKEQQWQTARAELEACTVLDPASSEGHFRLMQVYKRLHLPALAARQAELEKASDRAYSQANQQREQKTTQFLYTLRDSGEDKSKARQP